MLLKLQIAASDSCSPPRDATFVGASQSTANWPDAIDAASPSANVRLRTDRLLIARYIRFIPSGYK
jgi:hypothetical protein